MPPQQGKLVEVTSLVKHKKARSDRLLGFSVDRPAPGWETEYGADTFSLEFEGWALGKEPVVAVDLSQDGFTIWRMPVRHVRPDVVELHPDVPHAERSGFYFPINALIFTPEFELTVSAMLDHQTPVKIATLKGHRARVRSSHEPSIQPLLLSTTGRSGSTIMMRMLANHPQVIAYKASQVEARAASYWADVFMALTDPANYLRQLDAGGVRLTRGWSVLSSARPGIEPPPRMDDPDFVGWLGTASVEEAASFCHSRLDGFYTELARQSGRPDVVYFVEKCQTAAGNGVPSLLGELYPELREIVLVRDFRDMFCSWISYGDKIGRPAVGRDAEETDEDYARRWAANAMSMVNHWRRRKDRAHLIRYEDLVLEPRETIERLLAYLDLDTGSSIVGALAESISSKTPELAAHPTSDTPETSIGRWERDLRGDLRDLCQELFAEPLEAFGYPT